jgi:long-chain-fatty-acid--CoA ligase ACSBG
MAYSSGIVSAVNRFICWKSLHHQSRLASSWSSRPNGEVHIQVSSTGSASIPPVTVNDAFKSTVDKFPNRPALKVKRNNKWITWTYEEYHKDVTKAAKSMMKLGLQPHSGVGIIGFNSPEWFISYMGAIMAGGIATGIYSTNSHEACRYIADDCQAQIFICENYKQVEKIIKIKNKLPYLKAIVQYLPQDPQTTCYSSENDVIHWNEFVELGKNISDEDLQQRVIKQRPGNCASLVYTSGTTGQPKGVMLSHDNLIWSAKSASQYYNISEDTKIVSFLPLSHIAAQMIDINAAVVTGHCVWFAQPDALKGSIKDTLLEVKPTLFFAIPQLWEKIKVGVETKLNDVTGLRKKVQEISFKIGKKNIIKKEAGELKNIRGHWLANQLVFKNLRKKLGLGDCTVAATGAAPLSAEVIDFFSGFDMPIYQLYGMSETSGVGCLNGPNKFRRFSIGHNLNGVDIKLSNVSDSCNPPLGEICLKGRNIFMGYLHHEEKTKEIIDEDGWLHSGDIAHSDEDGFYYITGRLKELLITDGGENIAPVPIEENMLQYIKLFSHAVVIGDKRRYLTMLVTIKSQIDEDGNPTKELDQSAKLLLSTIGSHATTVPEAIADPIVHQYIEKEMKKANSKAISRAAQVKKYHILDQEFSISGGELTPTLKIKRNVINRKYKEIINQMYN